VAGWTPSELDQTGRAGGSQISSRRADGSPRPFVTIWEVRSGDGIFVGSAYGPSNAWYRRALASGTGRIRAGGVERDIRLAAADHVLQRAIDAAITPSTTGTARTSWARSPGLPRTT
jgi:hypothetical protein